MVDDVSLNKAAVHDYQALNIKIVKAIITERLDDFLAFARWGVTRK